MLRQISNVYEESEEPKKLWFTEEELDLFIWVSDQNEIVKFQFSYDKPNNEKLFLWESGIGLKHAYVDDGSRPGKYPSSPILLDEAPYDKSVVVDLLQRKSGDIPKAHLLFIKEEIMK